MSSSLQDPGSRSRGSSYRLVLAVPGVLAGFGRSDIWIYRDAARPAWQDRMVPTDQSPQLCATDSCGRPAVFRTRAKPTWCPGCLEGVYRTAGLRVLEAPTSYTTWHLTACLKCGVEAHYRLQNIIDQTALGTLTCQGCRWISWAESTRQFAGIDDAAAVVDVAAARIVAERHGYEYLRPLTDPSLADDPHHVKCHTCGRLSAERLSDIGWGCACSRNNKSAAPVQKSKTVLSDSGSPALAWWDHDRNDSSLLTSRTPKARLSVSWQCPTCGHRFEEQINAMTERPDCPACREGREAESARQHAEWARTPVSAVAELAAAWDDEADPDTVMVSGDWQLRRFRCAQGHRPSLRPSTFLESGCPSCSALATRRRGTPSLAETMPEIASQWNPDRNTLTAADVNGASRREVWWRDPTCGHEWRARVVDRDKYLRLRCPDCRTVLDSLAWQFPSLAGEWSVENSLTAWHVRPTGRTGFVPQWVCSTNHQHHWQATLGSRIAGSDCPECREAGKSRVELNHHEAAVALFGSARSGALVRSTVFRARPAWTVDILVEDRASAEQRSLVIEYDGAYWHGPETKRAVDQAKSTDLLEAGYFVVRLRESPLPALQVEHPLYLEVEVSSTSPRPHATITLVHEWFSAFSTNALSET